MHGALESGEEAARQLLRTHQYHACKAAGESPRMCICNGGARVWDRTKYAEAMISCDVCQRWYHGSCLGLDVSRYSDRDEFVCPECTC